MQADPEEWVRAKRVGQAGVPSEAHHTPPAGPDAPNQALRPPFRAIPQVDHRPQAGRIGETCVAHGPLRLRPQKPRRSNESPRFADAKGVEFGTSAPHPVTRFRGVQIVKFPLARSVGLRDEPLSEPPPGRRTFVIVPVEDALVPVGLDPAQPRCELRKIRHRRAVVMVRNHQQRRPIDARRIEVREHVPDPPEGERTHIMDRNHKGRGDGLHLKDADVSALCYPISEENPKQNPRQPNGSNGGDPQMNWRGLVLLSIGIALIGGVFLFRSGNFNQSEEITNVKFFDLLKSGRIVNTPEKPVDLIVGENRKTQSITGFYRDAQKSPGQEVLVPFTTPVFVGFNGAQIEKALSDAGIVPNIKPDSDLLASAIFSFLPIVLVLLFLYIFFRSQIKMAGRSALTFGKSKARMLTKDKNRITFKDVAGVEEAKEEVSELVDFLRDPKKYQKLGGRIPKGVLMVGAPGTGKTLIARAIAGEADVPFFSISGSDFVEMFVGVGASRVRDMFEQGRKSAPCLIFIDEIDAVGRHRGHGLGGGHDEREQTLNQLLVEMDGFDTQDGVIIIAATNRPDVLDPALLRPGRFDRQVTINLPDVKGREEILAVHAKKVKLSMDVDLAVIARGTPGFSGAELANLINEAALIAARTGLKGITGAELEEARDKVRWGRERRSLAMSEKEKISTAWHEAGHALLSIKLEHTDPLHKVTIIPRGRALGVTMSLPEGDQYSFHRKEALDMMAMTAAGRIAEELFTNDVSTGASNDIKQMTRLARKMVCEWGMSDALGMVEYGEHEEHVFLGRDINKNRDYSESTAQEIDREVRRLVDDAYARAKDLIVEYRDRVEIIAKALLEFETLDGAQVREIIESGRMSNPPRKVKAPPPLPPPPSSSVTEPVEPTRPDFPEGGFPAPAPA